MSEVDIVQKYEYLVTYWSTAKGGFSNFSQRGRLIKQTRKGADTALAWAAGRGYQTRLERREVGTWQETT